MDEPKLSPVIRLAPEDFARFVAVCQNPPPPSERMLAAIKAHHALVGNVDWADRAVVEVNARFPIIIKRLGE